MSFYQSDNPIYQATYTEMLHEVCSDRVRSSYDHFIDILKTKTKSKPLQYNQLWLQRYSFYSGPLPKHWNQTTHSFAATTTAQLPNDSI